LSIDTLGFLRAVTGNRQKHKVIGLRAGYQTVDLAQHVGAFGLSVDQGHDVLGAHLLQRVLDIARIGDGALELPVVLIGIDADDQGANVTAGRTSHREVLGGMRGGTGQRKRENRRRHSSDRR
jgi:hypothetical protein